jgi:hypothetical protein
VIPIGLLESAQESFVGVTRDLRTISLKYPLLLWWSLWNDGMHPGFVGRSCKLYPRVCTIKRYLLFLVPGCDPLFNPIDESLGCLVPVVL